MFDYQIFGAVSDVLADKGVLISVVILASILILCSRKLRFEYKGREREWSLEASKGEDQPKPKQTRRKLPTVATDDPSGNSLV